MMPALRGGFVTMEDAINLAWKIVHVVHARGKQRVLTEWPDMFAAYLDAKAFLRNAGHYVEELP